MRKLQVVSVNELVMTYAKLFPFLSTAVISDTISKYAHRGHWAVNAALMDLENGSFRPLRVLKGGR